MYKKESNSWLKHIDFVILDVFCLQLAIILSYWIRIRHGIPYKEALYENVAFVLSVFQILFPFLEKASAAYCEEGILLK